jgi:hypothetical protein
MMINFVSIKSLVSFISIIGALYKTLLRDAQTNSAYVALQIKFSFRLQLHVGLLFLPLLCILQR